MEYKGEVGILARRKVRWQIGPFLRIELLESSTLFLLVVPREG